MHSGDGCDLPSTLCKYDLGKGDLFVMIWARVLRERRVSISSELLTCGGGVRSILLLPLVTRCLETIWHLFIFMSVVLIVWVSVGMFVVLRPLLKIVFFSIGVLKYVVCLCKGCDGCFVFICIVYGKYECFVMKMLYVCVLCASCGSSQFCMTCSLLMLVEDARGDRMEEAYSRAGLMTAL